MSVAAARPCAYWIRRFVVVVWRCCWPRRRWCCRSSGGRFVTEILIWGLLAMSSDILIGYTGMVSFGHSAFFGLGMYGAAAALLTVKPPNLWLAAALRAGRRRGGGGLRRLSSPRGCARSTSPSPTLVFSQIFYVIIFTWTEVTGGENGLTFSQPPLCHPRAVLERVHVRRRCTGSCSAVVALSFLLAAPHHPVALRHGAPVDPRERAAHRGHRLLTSSATRSWR